MIEHSARDVSHSIHRLSTIVLESLQGTISANQGVNDEDRRAHYLRQANLCGIFTSIIHYDPTEVRANADGIMQTLLMVISQASKESTVKEEAFVAVGAVAGAVEVNFVRYMDPLMPYIYAALSNHEDYAVCSIVLGVLGDICRALGEKFFPYCETLIQSIGGLLNNPGLHRKVRPACLSAIGDISLAIGGQFEVYVHPAMGIVANIASQIATIPQVVFLLILEYSRAV